jgi:hypothetical protein
VSAPYNFADKNCFAFKVRIVFFMNNFQCLTDNNSYIFTVSYLSHIMVVVH